MNRILAAAALALALSATAAHADEDLTCPAAQQAFKTFVNLELRLAPSAASRATIHGRYDNTSLQGEIADKFDAQNRPRFFSCAEALPRGDRHIRSQAPASQRQPEGLWLLGSLTGESFCPSAGTPLLLEEG